ncbi:hypothetical protein Ahy_A02g009558 [Arachis hypogaea]|uniref:GRF-type domain-containing protein n=1 Tax=Arachis hypogaea TaxID=3818 RepID=A0A445EHE1_ARAHY|nr:hypothetical protein Ahy_A02g009558 [Arachis hypogaea]
MEAGNRGRSAGVSFPSNGSNGYSASMRTRKKTLEESCFCGLKAVVIKKSGTAENPNRLFHACPKRAVSHCNYFKWVDDDDYQGVAEGGTKKDYRTDLQVESDYDEWRLGSLKGEVKVLKLLIIFIFVVVVINSRYECHKVGQFLEVAELVLLIVSIEIATGAAAVDLGEDLSLTFSFAPGATTASCSCICLTCSSASTTIFFAQS